MKASELLQDWTREFRRRFVEEHRVMSFEQYVSLFLQQPHLLGRSAPQYLLDAMTHAGIRAVKSPTGTRRHFNVFDAEDHSGHQRLVGQEETQESFHTALSNLVQEGRGSRLLLLYGPNGSAKTSFVQCLAKALVHYGTTQDGAIYTYSWIFPKSGSSGRRVGFDRGETSTSQDTYAFLDESQVAARIPSDIRDNPIFLVPQKQRQDLLSSWATQNTGSGFRFSHHLLHGDLPPGSKAIFDTLLAFYDGDYQRVTAHIRVERFEFSRRYRQGIAVVEPQMHVDAQARQLTMDETWSYLPAVLRHLSLYQLSGDLVDAHRGMVEYSDLLKRPLDAFKYLLGTCENSRVELPGVSWYLDAVILGTTNDRYLHAFAKSPDFSSFKGRIELIRVPYIRDYTAEVEIYRDQISGKAIGKPIAPHTLELAALWAVLTRMRQPEPDRYPEILREAIRELSPLDKADLYATGHPPVGLAFDVSRELVAAIPQLYAEYAHDSEYEGFIGASAREIRTALFSAAQAPETTCLHPARLFDELRSLVQMKGLYDFLQIQPMGDYHHPERLLELVETRYLRILHDEIRSAMGLVGPEEFERLLKKYATHASAFLKKEQVMDPVTRKLGSPDESFMKEMEAVWQSASDSLDIRQDFLGRIASFSLDNPGVQPSYSLLFRDPFQKMQAHYFDQQGNALHRAIQDITVVLQGDTLEDDRTSEVTAIIDAMKSRFGYDDITLPVTIEYLRGKRS
jgi:predicted Ser/Thr protein kinase